MLLKSKYLCKHLLLLIFNATIFTSCTKDWLKQTSPLQIPSEEQFSTEGGFKDALIGVYITMGKYSGLTGANYSMDMTWNLMDRLSKMYAPYLANSPYLEFQNYNYFSAQTRPIVDAMWASSYNAIANINSALAQIEVKKKILHPVNYNLIKGELLGLRAFLHFDLMRMYGHSNYAGRPELPGKAAIPYSTSISKQYAPQLSYTETFKLMEADMDASLALLKDDPVYKGVQHPSGYYDQVNSTGFYNNREFRMNYYAVLSLKARVYMWEGKNNLVLPLAEEVINNAPVTLLTDAKGNTILKGEDIFSLNISQFLNLVDLYLDGMVNTNTTGIYLSQSDAEAMYETQDINIGLVDYRYNTMLESQLLGRVPIKLRQAGKPNEQLNRMPLIRVSELYYIAAESLADTDLPKAVEYLNIVRRARGILKDLAASDKSAFINELTKEYRKEFISEGQLFFYYKRMGFTSFPGLQSNLQATDKIYMLPFPDNEVEFGGRVQ